MRLLLTGFEPFGGETVNPSAEVVRRIAESPPTGVDVEVLVLPVRGRVTFELLVPRFTGGDYDAWLGLGQAGGRSGLSVERLGINLLIDRGASNPDATEGPVEELLVEGAPAAYFSRLPVTDVARRIASTGVAASVSNTAGAYICNEALFAMLHHLESGGLDQPVGFIHLPWLPEQALRHPGQPSMPLDEQVRGVRAAIEAVRDLLEARAGAVRS